MPLKKKRKKKVAFLVFTYFVSPITMDAVDSVLKSVENFN